MKNAKKIATLAILTTGMIGLAACEDTDANVASHNLSKAADQFEIDRRIVFVNGITDQYLLLVEGRCSINDDGSQLEVTCMTGPNEYKKHFLGLSDNVTYFAEHLDGTKVSTNHYRAVYKPATILPDIDVDMN